MGAGESAAGTDIGKVRAGNSHLSRESQVVAWLLGRQTLARLSARLFRHLEREFDGCWLDLPDEGDAEALARF